jgi:hypothetical protein
MIADGRPPTTEIGNGGRRLEVGDREPGDGTMDEFEQRDWVKLGVAATLSRQYAADQRAFLERLAEMLESALPDETEIGRRGGLFARKVARRGVVTLSENRYALEDTGGGTLRATRTHLVRGIALKTVGLPVEEWLAELGALLDERARTSAAARHALARWVE